MYIPVAIQGKLKLGSSNNLSLVKDLVAGDHRHAAMLPSRESSKKAHLGCHIYRIKWLSRSQIAYNGRGMHKTPCIHNFHCVTAPLWVSWRSSWPGYSSGLYLLWSLYQTAARLVKGGRVHSLQHLLSSYGLLQRSWRGWQNSRMLRHKGAHPWEGKKKGLYQHPTDALKHGEDSNLTGVIC